MIIKPIQLDGVPMRSHDNLGIFQLKNKIVFLHTILGDMPKAETSTATIFPNYIVAEFFTANLEEHTQKHLVYNEKKTLYPTCCNYKKSENGLLINTMYYQPVGGIVTNINHQNTIAKLIKVQDNSLCEIGTSPKPISKLYCDKKTFVFHTYAVRMASPFTMECTCQTNGKVIWKLRLNAWLYTDIQEKHGILYFGTAGRGGRFYGVSLHDGKTLFSYDTGGTIDFAWHGKNALMNDRKGNIVSIDSKTGAETKQFTVKHHRNKLYVFSKIMVIKNKLYTVARLNKVPYYDFYAICINLL